MGVRFSSFSHDVDSLFRASARNLWIAQVLSSGLISPAFMFPCVLQCLNGRASVAATLRASAKYSRRRSVRGAVGVLCDLPAYAFSSIHALIHSLSIRGLVIKGILSWRSCTDFRIVFLSGIILPPAPQLADAFICGVCILFPGAIQTVCHGWSAADERLCHGPR